MLLVIYNPIQDFLAGGLQKGDAPEERQDHVVEEGDVGVYVVRFGGWLENSDRQTQAALQSGLRRARRTCFSNSM